MGPVCGAAGYDANSGSVAGTRRPRRTPLARICRGMSVMPSETGGDDLPARGAGGDRTITSAIDAHVEAERGRDDDRDDGVAICCVSLD